MIQENFVLHRVVGHPELKYESALKNQIDGSYIVASEQWQVIESNNGQDGVKGSNEHHCGQTHMGQNRCYLCEKAPYTLLFYQREAR